MTEWLTWPVKSVGGGGGGGGVVLNWFGGGNHYTQIQPAVQLLTSRSQADNMHVPNVISQRILCTALIVCTAIAFLNKAAYNLKVIKPILSRTTGSTLYHNGNSDITETL